MRNCLILGSGRSGTSMLAGSLAGAGYFMGSNLVPASRDNPKGFFEDREINSINEALLAHVTPANPTFDSAADDKSEIRWGWRWLAKVPVSANIRSTSSINDRIRKQVSHTPFCFKDPRFCYTLPAWKPYLRDVIFVCVFREPARTAHSIVKSCERGVYLHGLRLTFDEALDVWCTMYRHVLEQHCKTGTWLFIHFDQILAGSAFPELENTLGVEIDRNFRDATLRRSLNEGAVPTRAAGTYRELCDLAEYEQI